MADRFHQMRMRECLEMAEKATTPQTYRLHMELAQRHGNADGLEMVAGRGIAREGHA